MVEKKKNKDIRVVPIKELDSGMILMEDLIDVSGVILLKKGFKIYDIEKVLSFIKNHEFESDSILVEILEKTIEDYQEEDINKFKKGFYNVKKEMIDEVKKIMFKEEIKKEEIEEMIDEILQSAQGRLNVFQLLQKIREENDAIYSHSFDLMLVSHSIGKWIGFNKEILKELSLSALLSDIGKVKISRKIIEKTDKLTKEEEAELKKHVVHSFDMVKNYTFMNDRIKEGVLFHHERFDGSGYPRGFVGTKIPVFARIIAIADIYTALIEDRPYRNRLSPLEAIKILELDYKEKLDIEFLYIFIRKIADRYIGSKIKLNDGRKGQIVFFPRFHIYRPIIKLENEEIIDLLSEENKSIEIVDFI